jgi:hypothetical protein
MRSYVLVNNRPNQIATVHKSTCANLGPEPLLQTGSADRIVFDDALHAIKAASETTAKNFVLCGHCLGEYQRFVRTQIA